MKVAKMEVMCALFLVGGLGSFAFARTQQSDDSAASRASDEQQAHASGEMAVHRQNCSAHKIKDLRSA